MSELPRSQEDSNFTIAKEGEPKQEPFKIRGHHLLPFKRLVQKTFEGTVLSPEEVAKDQRSDYTPGGLLSAEAIKDTVGTTLEEGDQFEQSLKKVFTEFIQLPDDYPVELTEGRKDRICEKCPIKGAHCEMKDLSVYERGTKDIVKYDGEEINNFLKKARKNNLEEAITIREERAFFSNNPPQMTRTAATNAGTFKAILKNW